MNQTNFYQNQNTGPITNDEPLEKLKEILRFKAIMRRVFYVAVSVILALILIIGIGAIFMRVKRINVVGMRKVDPYAIVDASGVRADENLYAVDRADIRRAIMDEFPYISDVKVKRLLPTTLQLEVTEDEAVYYTEICGEYFVLSDKLRVLEKTTDFSYVDSFEPALKIMKIPDCIYAVVGDPIVFTNENVTEYAEDLLVRLGVTNQFDKVTEVDFSRRFNIYITLDGRWRIFVGDSGDLETKLTFAGMMIETFDETQAGEVDAHDVSVGSVILNNSYSEDE